MTYLFIRMRTQVNVHTREGECYQYMLVGVCMSYRLCAPLGCGYVAVRRLSKLFVTELQHYTVGGAKPVYMFLPLSLVWNVWCTVVVAVKLATQSAAGRLI